MFFVLIDGWLRILIIFLVIETFSVPDFLL